MIKKIIPLLLISWNCGQLQSEGFTTDTQVATWQAGMKPMANVCQGLDLFSLNAEGKIVPGRVILKEVIDGFSSYELTINNNKIHADAEQYFYSPNRDAWVKLTDLEIGKDSVYSIIKGALLVQDCKKMNLAVLNVKVPMHRISVELHENYFITDDLILVHNFVPVIAKLGQVILNHAIDIAAAMAVSMASSYITDKVTPYLRSLLHLSPPAVEIGSSAQPKIAMPANTGIIPPISPPPPATTSTATSIIADDIWGTITLEPSKCSCLHRN